MQFQTLSVTLRFVHVYLKWFIRQSFISRRADFFGLVSCLLLMGFAALLSGCHLWINSSRPDTCISFFKFSICTARSAEFLWLLSSVIMKRDKARIVMRGLELQKM